MNSLYLIIVIAVIALIVTFNMLTKKKYYKNSFDRVFKITNTKVLPSGLTLMIEDSADTPTEAEITAIETGLNRCFIKAAKIPGYTRPFNLSDYKIAIFGDSERSPEAKTWCYKLPAGMYGGSQWDMGGYILAAGEMVFVGEPYGNVIAIPDHHGTDLEELALVCEYEAEHVILAWCDGDKFEATKIHGYGQGHPLF